MSSTVGNKNYYAEEIKKINAENRSLLDKYAHLLYGESNGKPNNPKKLSPLSLESDALAANEQQKQQEKQEKNSKSKSKSNSKKKSDNEKSYSINKSTFLLDLNGKPIDMNKLASNLAADKKVTSAPVGVDKIPKPQQQQQLHQQPKQQKPQKLQQQPKQTSGNIQTDIIRKAVAAVEASETSASTKPPPQKQTALTTKKPSSSKQPAAKKQQIPTNTISTNTTTSTSTTTEDREANVNANEMLGIELPSSIDLLLKKYLAQAANANATPANETEDLSSDVADQTENSSAQNYPRRHQSQSHNKVRSSSKKPHNKDKSHSHSSSKRQQEKERGKSRDKKEKIPEKEKASIVEPVKKNATQVFKIRNDDDFQVKVMDNTSRPVIVEFHSQHCAPCKILEPLLEKEVRKYDGKVDMGKCNINDSYIASDYDINSVPTMIIFRNGEEIERILGLPNNAKLAEFVKKASKL